MDNKINIDINAECTLFILNNSNILIGDVETFKNINVIITNKQIKIDTKFNINYNNIIFHAVNKEEKYILINVDNANNIISNNNIIIQNENLNDLNKLFATFG